MCTLIFQFPVLICCESFGYYELFLGIVGFYWCLERPLPGNFVASVGVPFSSLTPSTWGLHMPNSSKPFPVGYCFLYLSWVSTWTKHNVDEFWFQHWSIISMTTSCNHNLCQPSWNTFWLQGTSVKQYGLHCIKATSNSHPSAGDTMVSSCKRDNICVLCSHWLCIRPPQNQPTKMHAPLVERQVLNNFKCLNKYSIYRFWYEIQCYNM